MLNVNNLDLTITEGNRNETRQWQDMLKNSFREQYFTISDNGETFHSESLQIWVQCTYGENGRYGNKFGKIPKDIVCEVNPPHEGIVNRSKGLYLIDANNDIYLGRRDGFTIVDANTELSNWIETWPIEGRREFTINDKPETVAIIAKLESDDFHEKLAFFIDHVQNFKNEKRNANND